MNSVIFIENFFHHGVWNYNLYTILKIHITVFIQNLRNLHSDYELKVQGG